MMPVRPASRGRNGDRTSANGSGARSARTTATTAMPGRISHTSSRGRAPTAGAKTAWAASPMTSSDCASRSRCGTGAIPILKERLFGLTNSEGNHGEDVKEYYFYIDSTPTHSYMKYLYKYPQREFPYRDLVETNRMRSREELEYELLDTGAFDEDRYFDVFVEYAKAGPEDLLIRITVHNRGPESARLRPAADAVVPQHLVMGRRRPQARAARSGTGRHRSVPSRPREVRAGIATGRRSCCSPRTRATRSCCGDSRMRRRT